MSRKPVMRKAKQLQPEPMRVERWTCVRCGHSWLPRIERPPLKCPDCQSKRWRS